MTHEVIIHYSPDVIDAAARRFFWRFVSKQALADLMYLAIVLGLWAGGALETTWALVLLGIGVGLIALVAFTGWRYVRLARSKFDAMADPVVIWRVGPETLATESSLGSVQVPWRTITAVWRFDEVWLLFFGGHGYSTLPTQPLSPELKAFIADRVAQHGGKVTNYRMHRSRALDFEDILPPARRGPVMLGVRRLRVA